MTFRVSAMSWFKRKFSRKLALAFVIVVGLSLTVGEVLSMGSAILAIVAGWVVIFAMSRWITRPLAEITQVAKSISDGHTDMRVPVNTDDEVGELAKTFNQMADRLEATLKQVRTEKEEMEAILRGLKETVKGVEEKER